jgi:hypothetical protein
MLNRVERAMLLEHEWPTLHFEEDIIVLADEQFVDMPNNIKFTMIESVHVAYGSEWYLVTSGIGASERTIYNDTQRAIPISRYEATANQPNRLKIWPIGEQNQTLKIEGMKSVGAMVNETDECTLDGDALVLTVAAQILGRENKADAELALTAANKIINNVTKRQGSMKSQNVNFGQRRQTILRPGIDYIPPGS